MYSPVAQVGLHLGGCLQPLPFKKNLGIPSVFFMPIKLILLHNLFYIRWMNDCLIVYIEKDVAGNIDNEIIMQRFQNMKTRKRQL